MEIKAITEDQLGIIGTLAARLLIQGKSSLFIVPEPSEDMDTETRNRLTEKSRMAEELKELELLTEVTEQPDFAKIIQQLKEEKKRSVKIYTIAEKGLAIVMAQSDQWDDDKKKAYTEKTEQWERDKQQENLEGSVREAITEAMKPLKEPR